ncbi:MAG TPA: NRDE family protein [Streptosporangiaceae bacterium]|nr:NRDE family protein [Streptosporangiaceae bacterium]
MCTAILSIEPGAPVLLAGVRDELVDRASEPPARHWPDHPGLIGGRDLVAGGTWLAVAPSASRVACVLNGRGAMAPGASRRTRGVLPLQAADEAKLDRSGLDGFDPFHLLFAEPGAAVLWSWDGERLAERELGAGLHIVVNSGLDDAGDLRDHERARIAHFLPRLREAARPFPGPDETTAQAWGSWLPLLNGDGLTTDDMRALIVRRDLGSGRIWGTSSISLVALGGAGTRYDFTAAPGDPRAWYPVPVG